MTESQRKYMREYYHEYRKHHRAEINNRQKLASRMKNNSDKARRIEEVKAYYRADLPPVDGVIMDANKTRLEIYYNQDGYRRVTERWFEDSADCAVHYTAICDLMKEGQ